MTKRVDKAIEVLRDLPVDQQETVANAILDYASHDDGRYHLSDLERDEVCAALAEVRMGKLVTREVRASIELTIARVAYLPRLGK